MAKYFRYAFGVTGDRATMPDVSTGGFVAYDTGYGIDYSRNRLTDPLAKNIARDTQNQLFYDITNALKQYQENGTPDFITSADNGGVAFSYAKNSVVRYNDGVSTERYMSLINSNNTLPTVSANWRKLSALGAFLDTANDFTAANSFIDTLFTLKDNADVTKTAQFDLSGLTTATLRTYTLPDANTALGGTSSTNVWTGSNTFVDSSFFIRDDATPTKIVQFQCATVAAGTNVWTFPAIAATSFAHIGNAAQTFAGQMTFSSTAAFLVSASTSISIGTPTAASTVNIGTGATVAAATKTINIGSSGVSTSITNVNIGSAVGGALGTLTVYQPVANFSGAITALSLAVTGSTIVTNGIYLDAANTPTISANSLRVMQFTNSGTAINYFTTTNSAAGVALSIAATGADTNISISLTPKGTGVLNTTAVNVTGSTAPSNGLYLASANQPAIVANGLRAMQFAVGASAVNYWLATGVATGNSLTLTAVGSDTNIPAAIIAKGTGEVQFYTQGGLSTGWQVSVIDTVSAVNRLTLTGSATTNAVTIGAAGTDTNISMTLAPKGTGIVNAPALNVTSVNKPANGLYLPAANNPGITANSLDVVRFTAAASSVNYFTLNAKATGASPNIIVAGSDTNIGLEYYTKGTGAHVFRTDPFGPGPIQFQITHVASAVNYLSVNGGATLGSPSLVSVGSDTNIGMTVSTKGTGAIGFYTNNGAQLQAAIEHTPSAVNYIALAGGATGVATGMYARGSDTNVAALISSKGTGAVDIYTGGGRQFQVKHTASAVNYVTQSGSATGAACFIAVEGSDTNITAVFGGKGTGSTFIGSYNLGQALEVQGISGIQNYFRLTPGGTGVAPTWNAIGSDANINFFTVAKGTGVLVNLGSYTNSTTGTANVIIDTNGLIRRTTSMLKYKTDIEEVEVARAMDVFENVRPVWFRDKRDPVVSHYSVIAEEIAEIDPRLAHYGFEPLDTFDKDGMPELGDVMVPVGVQMERVLLMAFVATRERIKVLEAELAKLKSKGR